MRTRQIMVIGLGQFGLALAAELHQRGADVLAADRSEERVRQAQAVVTQAVVLDATDEHALLKLSPQKRDVVVCAIGDEARDSAILVTMLLCQMGCRRVVARATSDMLARILKVIGAHEVVSPERSFGERYAGRLLFEHIQEEIPLGEDLIITEMTPPPSFVGQSLESLRLPARFRITVLGVRHAGHHGGQVVVPDPTRLLQEGDVLVLASSRQALRDLTRRL
jgi:trk system potassium uptake protein TrkA